MARAESWALALFRRSILKQRKLAEIAAMLGPTEGLRCLDLGSDNGVVSLLLRERGGDWASADLTEEAVSAIRDLVGTDVHRCDGGHLPFADAELPAQGAAALRIDDLRLTELVRHHADVTDPDAVCETRTERLDDRFFRGEAVNFFSLNIHGERMLVAGIAQRLYRTGHAETSRYLHHFLAEENRHMVLISLDCGVGVNRETSTRSGGRTRTRWPVAATRSRANVTSRAGASPGRAPAAPRPRSRRSSS